MKLSSSSIAPALRLLSDVIIRPRGYQLRLRAGSKKSEDLESHLEKQRKASKLLYRFTDPTIALAPLTSKAILYQLSSKKAVPTVSRNQCLSIRFSVQSKSYILQCATETSSRRSLGDLLREVCL